MKIEGKKRRLRGHTKASRRTHNLTIRLNDEELLHLKLLSAQHRQTMTNLVRNRLAGLLTPRPLTVEEVRHEAEQAADWQAQIVTKAAPGTDGTRPEDHAEDYKHERA